MRLLGGLSDSGLGLPCLAEGCTSVWHLFVVRCPDRDGLQKELGEHGIGTLIHYPVPPHLQDAYRELGYGPGSFPLAEQLADEVLSLPMGPHIDDGQIEDLLFVLSGTSRRLCRQSPSDYNE